ncbi:response regulator transcription factor [Acinetobacter sp. WCHAc010052]|jgi:two-component system OmpR family response regulator|uniref:response regulator transcription factor n=1 Tax=Acinetobacter sp. WCHAc010052 TaxID=2004647 RepID=UPI000B3C1E4E|nr:response regulator transcription factor [Acinetobacter sp. WCHAc010052]AXY60597.1 DNA-binding response regulator [Acinetobacter sp. WCHAc010052]
MRILLAEDDVSQAESIKTWLEMDGYHLDWVERGDHAIHALAQHEYDCVLLDRGLPVASGDEILKKLRKDHPETPVIFLTARDAVQDRVEGLDMGANDYLVKPFSLEELSARVRTQLRQRQQTVSDQISFGDIVLNPAAKSVHLNGQPVNLTAREFQLLHKLMLRPEHIVTREQLEESLYAWGDEIESNAIEVFIYQLRKKIGSHYIKTVRGLGYKMNLQKD